jgi:hypothetical protein
MSRGKPVKSIKSFSTVTSPVASAEYLGENLLQSDHLLLDFDHKEIGGKRVTPPKLQGVSGGGIFHISKSEKQGQLVAIAMRNPRNSRRIVGTRIKHFLRVARELTATGGSAT